MCDAPLCASSSNVKRPSPTCFLFLEVETWCFRLRTFQMSYTVNNLLSRSRKHREIIWSQGVMSAGYLSLYLFQNCNLAFLKSTSQSKSSISATVLVDCLVSLRCAISLTDAHARLSLAIWMRSIESLSSLCAMNVSTSFSSAK